MSKSNKLEHVAFILDGNKRWSKKNNVSLKAAYKEGLKNIENSILESNLGINPQVDGALIRLPIPKLSEERRGELTKIASQYAENFKVSIRNIRRDFIEIKKGEKKESLLSEDELKKFLSEAQNYTDKYIASIDKILEQKKSDIMKV